MNVEVIETSRGTMAEDTHLYFMAAWRHFMRQTKITQRKIAVGTGNSAQWINCAYKERPDTKTGKIPKVSSELQEKIAGIFGYNYIEFLQTGKRILENIPGVKVEKEEPKTVESNQDSYISSVIPGVQARHVNPNDFMTEVSVFVGQYQKQQDRLKFWKAIFENLPVPALIIRDGLVCFQNIKSRLWGIITGTNICDSCVGLGCENRDDCPVVISERTATECSGYQMIGAQRYKMDVMPLRLHEHDYFLVCATDVHGVEDDRRIGGDRRHEV